MIACKHTHITVIVHTSLSAGFCGVRYDVTDGLLDIDMAILLEPKADMSDVWQSVYMLVLMRYIVLH